jgi:ABC-type branched-subunit amino acid transport system permease subunit
MFLLLWGTFAGVIFFCFRPEMYHLTEDGEIIDIITNLGYVALVAVLLAVADDYKENMKSWGAFLFLAIVAFLREQGIQHHLSKTDTTPFKSRFFLNPNNPMSEKIIFGAVLLLVFGVVLYLAIKYAKHLILSFFKLNPITWSIATLCTVGVFAKWTDRYPSGWRKAHGVSLPQDEIAVWSLLEESTEMFLPWLAVLILLQYHKKAQN